MIFVVSLTNLGSLVHSIKFTLVEKELNDETSTDGGLITEEIPDDTQSINDYVDWLVSSNGGLPQNNEEWNTTNVSIRLNNSLYMNWTDYADCYIDFNKLDNGKHSSKMSWDSYILVYNNNDLLNKLYINLTLINNLYILDVIDYYFPNCSVAPVMKVSNYSYDSENELIKIYIQEAAMHEYIESIDSDLEQKNLYTLNTIAEVNTENLDNILDSNLTNGSMLLSEIDCFLIAENGTEIGPFSGNNCSSEYNSELSTNESIITEFGTLFGTDGFKDSNELNLNRRRLRRKFRRRLRKTVKKAVNVGKKVKNVAENVPVVNEAIDFVETVIDILSGNINEQFTLGGLRINPEVSFSLEGEKEKSFGNGKGSISGDGTFEINSGANLVADAYIKFIAKYKLFSTNPSFDELRAVIGTKLDFSSYFNLLATGHMGITYEPFSINKRKVFFIGPVPIEINFFSDLTFNSDLDTSMSLAYEAGISPIDIEFGMNYKNGDYNIIQKYPDPTTFEPYFNFGAEITTEDNEDVNEEVMSELGFHGSLEVGADLRIGAVLYEVATFYNGITISSTSNLDYPFCNDELTCYEVNQDPSLSISVNTRFNSRIGIDVSIDEIGLPVFSHEENILEIPIEIASYSDCITAFIAPLYYPVCGLPEGHTAFPTQSPSGAPTLKPTQFVCPFVQGACNAGYLDKTKGNYKIWACGIDCPGGAYLTNGACNCACIPEEDLCPEEQIPDCEFIQGRCDAGYVDKTKGNTQFWSCGKDCEGGKYLTNSYCNCACLPEEELCPSSSRRLSIDSNIIYNQTITSSANIRSGLLIAYFIVSVCLFFNV
jgi:hypothetical protein